VSLCTVHHGTEHRARAVICRTSCLYVLCIMGLNITLELLFPLSRSHELADSKRFPWNKVLSSLYKSLYFHGLHINTTQAYSDVGHCQFVAHWCSLSYTGSRNARSIVAMETGLHVEGHRLIKNTCTNYSIRCQSERRKHVAVRTFLHTCSLQVRALGQSTKQKFHMQTSYYKAMTMPLSKTDTLSFTAFRYIFNLRRNDSNKNCNCSCV
jgi:hypothetical protein